MSSECGIRIMFEDLRSLAFGGISGTYAGVGTAFQKPVRMLKITNLTDAALIISFNGINDKDVIAANSAFIYDYGSNKSDSGGIAEQTAFERVYVREESSSPTSGSVYVTSIYLDSKG